MEGLGGTIRAWFAIALVAAAASAGCGDGGSEREPVTHRVAITKDGYKPAHLRIAVGDSVVFTNRVDGEIHSAQDDSRGKIEVSPNPGVTMHDGSEVNHATRRGFATHALFYEEWQRVVFDAVQSYEYHSTYDTGMRGKLEVVDGD